jgi:hypothetical protein
MSFTEWTVLPHDGIKKLAPNLWTVSGTMPKGNQRRMTIARLADGRLIVHNAIALDPNEMSELDAFGDVAAILVPNGFHRQDARIWKDRYPAAKVYAPRAAMAKVGKLVPVDGDYDAVPRDADVHAEHLDGMNGKEGVLLARSGSALTAVFNDVVLNMPPARGMMGLFLAPTGRPSVPRFTRLFMLKDKALLEQHLGRIAGDGLTRVLPGHGRTLDVDAAETLRRVAAELVD